MAKPKANEKVVSSAVDKAAADVFEGVNDRIEKAVVMDRLVASIAIELEGLDYLGIAEALAPAAFDRQYKKRADIAVSPQMDMDEYCSAFGKYANGDICPIGKGTWELHISRRERQIKHIVSVTGTFNAEEDLRNSLRDMMEAHPKMKTETAMKKLGMK